MARYIISIFPLILFYSLHAQINPAKDYGDLFNDVQLQHIFSDQKKFTDCIPKFPGDSIRINYEKQRNKGGFKLGEFVAENFDTSLIDTNSLLKHIEHLWSYLTHKPSDTTIHSTLIYLPEPYIVPGGRFREIYYWDSYFTMLGLAESGKYEIIENMIDNFSYLINTYGHIPNGNRTYYLSRSQPPFYSLMITLLAGIKGEQVYEEYLPYLEKEYEFWMQGNSNLTIKQPAHRHVVKIGNHGVLNRYWDELSEPRPEAYKWDVELQQISERKDKIYRHIRAAAESGWDFSSRWFEDGESIEKIITTDIIPVDLNCLLYHLEKVLSVCYNYTNHANMSTDLEKKAEQRKELINTYLWNKDKGYYFDFNIRENTATSSYNLAGVYPLFFELADSIQAANVKNIIEESFLKDGGLVTTLKETGQQWDYPNGWAPLQWVTYQSLKNYNYNDIANEIAGRWINLNCKVFFETGKMMEKYDVVDLNRPGGGGEYKLQDGFGWTNGVFLKMWNELHALN